MEKTATPPTPTSKTDATAKAVAVETSKPKKHSWKQRILVSLFLFVFACVLGVFLIRWIGSTTLRGTIQRTYEKQAEYRVEFAELDGTIHVVGNQEIHFPFFKVDTADVQAELNHMKHTGDVVDLKVWGLRIPWFSLFPNVVDLTFVRSDSDRRRAEASRIADEVLEALRQRGILKGGDDVRDDVIQAIERGLEKPNKDTKTAPGAAATPTN
jgi:hypothetical protein